MDANRAARLAEEALQAAFGGGGGGGGGGGSRVLVLMNMVTEDDLNDDANFEDLVLDIRSECARLASLISIKIPRNRDGNARSAVGKVFLEYATPQDAAQAQRSLEGRQFGDSYVRTEFFDERSYLAGLLA